MENALIIVELIIGFLLIIIVLLQAKGTSASALMSRNSTATYRTRRGVEKTLYNVTIVLGITFVILSLLHPFLITI